MQNYKYRYFERLLINNGYVSVRQKGSHKIFVNGANSISIPVDTEVNGAMGRKIIKDFQLIQ